MTGMSQNVSDSSQKLTYMAYVPKCDAYYIVT